MKYSERVEAKVIADSQTPPGYRLTTLEVRYPFYIHGEVMTHRVFSRNAQSARAIPFSKYMKDLMEDEWYPIFMKNQSGMAASDYLSGQPLLDAKAFWEIGKEEAIKSATTLYNLDIHKQIANRIVQPFSKITAIISATEWNNFFRLRIHPDAQQEMQELARAIRDEMAKSTPSILGIRDWHLPYITKEEKENFSIQVLKKLSTARCARVSYLNHGGTKDTSLDLELHDRLWSSKHLSPFEHIATPWDTEKALSNFRGWRQYRWDLENDVE